MIPARSGHLEDALITGHAHESNWPVTLPLIILAIFSAIAGYLPFHHLLPAGPAHEGHEGGHIIQMLSLGCAAGGFILAFLIYFRKKHAPKTAGPLVVLQKKYFFDDFYDVIVIKGVQENLAKFFDFFERIVVVEGGANGTARITQVFGDIVRKLQTGLVQFYALIFAAGLTFIFYAVLVWGRS